MIRRTLLLALIPLWLAGCGSAPPISGDATVDSEKGSISKKPSRKPRVVLKRGGGFYKDDGPADDIPDGLDDIPDAVPKWEPLHKPALKPYVVLGEQYVPNTTVKPYKARGIASWYGKKFHGQKTSTGETYDMFAMTAAHTTLALPSYVRVTNLSNGQSVIVRVNDRGPFHSDRIIDLSYTAAYKLGLIDGGSGMVEVEAIIPGTPSDTSYAQITPPAPVDKAAVDEIEQLARREAAPAPSNDNPPAGNGIYLQLGAFANLENAENLRTHLLRELDWLTDNMRINAGGGIHRVQLGPYASRGEAEAAAERIRGTLGFKPTLVIIR